MTKAKGEKFFLKSNLSRDLDQTIKLRFVSQQLAQVLQLASR